MTPLAYLALIGWVPFVVALFATLPPRRAAAIAVIGAWLVLPPYVLPISGLPDYSKNTAATVGMALGLVLFNADRLMAFRPRWFDLPMALWCACPLASSLQNGLGLYDGLSETLTQLTLWGLPYFLGRIYFGGPEDLRYFAVAMVIGGLAYVPPCLFEMKMSPVLLGWIYGRGGFEGYRLGGWRPHVIFATGLELGMWMTAALLTAWWLWRSGALKRLFGVPFGPVLLPVLAVTTFFCRSTGALALLVMAVAVLWLSTLLRTRLLMAALLLIGPVYAVARSTNAWSGLETVEFVRGIVGRERAESLEYRFTCENLLAAHALEMPVFGWGGWDRSAVYWNPEASSDRRERVPTDGMWIVYLGTKGIVGLSLFFASMILPAALFTLRFPARTWGDPLVAAGALASVLIGVYMVDCLLNGFVNIIYITLAGGLVGLDPRHLGASSTATATTGRREPTAGVRRAPSPTAGRLAQADRCRTLGRSFRRDGRPDLADDAWHRALDLLAGAMEADPSAIEVRRRWCDCANDLAWLRANHPDPSRRDPASAVALARRAVEECPDSAAYWNTLGVARYRDGDPAAAADALERATALGGGTAFDDVFLAMAHARLGDPERARKDLARAMLRAERDHPGHPELAALCDEAHALLLGGAAAPAAV